MSDAVVLGSGPLGLLTNPNNNPVPVAIRQWLVDLLTAGRRVILPEIADYEIRREYIRANLSRSLGVLDSLANQIEYLPLSTAMVRRAAELWAQARNTGQPTAPDHALDGDVILTAQRCRWAYRWSWRPVTPPISPGSSPPSTGRTLRRDRLGLALPTGAGQPRPRATERTRLRHTGVSPGAGLC